jgi:adenylylsulfate kinase-like enzyme
MCIWFTGLSGSGKTTLANELHKYLNTAILLDGDVIRKAINYDLSYSLEDRNKNVNKIANLTRLLMDQKFNVIVSCISKELHQRVNAKSIIGNYFEIHVDASYETLAKRDTKGLYKNASALLNYETGNADLTIHTDNQTIQQSIDVILNKLQLN